MKISKRTREQAWLICAIAASWGDRVAASVVAGHLDISGPAIALACSAWYEGRLADRELSMPEEYAAGAALLAEGWCPP